MAGDVRLGDDLFEAAFYNAPVAAALFGDDGRFLKVNPALCDLLGYAQAELLDLRFQDVTHPEDIAGDLSWLDRFNRNAIRTARYEKRYVRRDGQAVWVDLSLTLVERAGFGRFTIGQIQDLTERRSANDALADSELKFRAIAENTTDAIVATDLNGRITFLSASCDGLVRAPPQTGAPYSLAGVRDQRRLRAARSRLLRGQNVRPLRWRIVETQTGRVVHLESQLSLVRERDTHSPKAFIDVIRDVTKQVEHEDALRSARAEAERLAGVKARFMANMSHEIRTPLTAIIGFTELSQRIEGLPPKARVNLERIHSAGEILTAIVNDILDFSKLEAGAIAIVPRPTEAVALVESVLQIFSPRAEGKSVRLDRAFSAPADLLVDLDPERLRQILVNILGNAVKFTTQGAVVTTVAYDVQAERLTVEVRDNGPGFTAEEQDRLFQRFSEIEASVTREHGGAGLGLTICRGLAEAMGGGLDIVSTPGQGTRFRLAVPAPCVMSRPAPPSVAPQAMAGHRILIVDDTSANRDLVKAALDPFDIEIVEAVDGQAGVAAAAREKVDLVLMDIRMPVMSGRDALYRIRTEGGPNAQTPIIAFTADTLFDPVPGCRPFDGVLHKPVTVHQLLNCLQTHLPAS